LSHFPISPQACRASAKHRTRFVRKGGGYQQVNTICQRSDQVMLSSDETRAGGKPKSRKARPRKSRAAQVPEMDPPHIVPEVEPVVEIETAAPVAVAETAVVGETAAPAPAAETAAPAPSADEAPSVIPGAAEDSVAPPTAEETAPVSYRTIADAWG